MSAALTPDEIARALDIARELVKAGIPVFVAPPSSTHGTGFALPSGWQNTQLDMAVVDLWQPGWALCAVMGHELDLVDVDPRNGGAATEAALRAGGMWPYSYGRAATPSGGTHDFIASLGVRSRDNVAPGLDVKAGDPNGEGRGFAFISPTVKASKDPANPGARPYRWLIAPVVLDAETLTDDDSGDQLAAMVRAARNGKAGTRPIEHMGPVAKDVRERVSQLAAELASTPAGGVHEAVSSLAYRAGQYAGAGQIGREEVTAILVASLAGWTWARSGDEQETHRKIESQVRAGALKPRAWGSPESGGAVVELPPDWPRTPFGPAAAETAARGREGLNVSNAAVAADWLRENIGAGQLSGIFKRGDASRLVHTPSIGEHGYRPAGGDDDDGPTQVRPISAGELAARTQYTWNCYRERKAKDFDEPGAVQVGDDQWVTRTPAVFPHTAAQFAVAAPDMLPNVRRLRGVVHTPVVRKDGSILDVPGYDAQSKLLYLPEPSLIVASVPEAPTAADVTDARKLLLYMIDGFPFVTDHDRAHFLGALLTPLLRDIVPPPYKLVAINASQMGSGKTLLNEILRTVHGGVFRSEMPEDDAELRKQITTILDQTTGPVVAFDNVTGLLRSSTLAGLLTSAVWDDRRLGANELARCVNDRLWTITGNNVAIGGDLARRTIWITIDPKMPDPQLRTDFAITDLPAWVRAHRGELLHALLVLVRAWIVDDRPGVAVSSDGFAEWTRSVGGILGVAGIAGTFDAPESRVHTEGTDDVEWAEFLAAIEAAFPGAASWTTRDVIARIQDPRGGGMIAGGVMEQYKTISWDALPGELAEKAARGGVATIGKSLGWWLANREGRWAGGLTVRRAGAVKNGQKWQLERYVPGGQ